MGKIKVLFEAGPLVDNKRTGVGNYCTQLISSLDTTHGDSTTLVGYYFDLLKIKNKQPPDLPNTNFRAVRLVPGKLLSLCRRLKFQPPLELFVPRKADVVIYTNYVSLTSVRKLTTVLVVYDLSFLDHPEYLQKVNLAFMQHFCPPSIRRANIIITISEFTKDRILHYFPDLKAEIVITPIPPEPLTEKTWKLSKRLINMGVREDGYILYLGTIEPRKNIVNLIEAYRLLPVSIRNENALVLAGGKGWKDEEIVAEIAKAKTEGLHIITTGYISDDEKNALYACSKCFVFPSHYEGFGIPILEAMQHKVPVAVSDIPVFHEVAGDAAIYFDKDSPDDIADVVAELVKNGDLKKQLIKRGSIRFKHFSWQQNADLVYRSIRGAIE